MTPAEVAAILRAFNDWRRGHHDDAAQPDPREIGEAIDAAIEMIGRLEAAERERDWHAERCEDAMNECAALRAKIEAAEKSDAESIAMYRKARDERDALRAALQHEADCVEAAKAEIEALRAKIAEMEQQEPARLVTPTAYRWRRRGSVMWQYGELTEETVQVAKEHNHEVQALGILPGAQTQPAPSVPSEQDESVRKAWSRFSNELHRSPDAPYPGMSEAFEQHFSQSFIDREWRSEAATWAAAWKAAKRHCAQPAPSVPEVTDAMAIAFHAALTDGGIGLQEVEEIKTGLRAALAAAPEAKP